MVINITEINAAFLIFFMKFLLITSQQLYYVIILCMGRALLHFTRRENK